MITNTETTRHSIRVHYDNGDTVDTDINGTTKEILSFYVGNWFNLGNGRGGDLMAKAVRVEFLNGTHPDLKE